MIPGEDAALFRGVQDSECIQPCAVRSPESFRSRSMAVGVSSGHAHEIMHSSLDYNPRSPFHMLFQCSRYLGIHVWNTSAIRILSLSPSASVHVCNSAIRQVTWLTKELRFTTRPVGAFNDCLKMASVTYVSEWPLSHRNSHDRGVGSSQVALYHGLHPLNIYILLFMGFLCESHRTPKVHVHHRITPPNHPHNTSRARTSLVNPLISRT